MLRTGLVTVGLGILLTFVGKAGDGAKYMEPIDSKYMDTKAMHVDTKAMASDPKGMDAKSYDPKALDSKQMAQIESSNGDEGDWNNPFTLSAAVREEYDSNIFTSSTNEIASWKTILTPSVLFTYPMDNTTFSARAEFDGTYYSNRSPDWDTGASLLARINHNFTDRFSIDIRDFIRYAQEPEIFSGGSPIALQREGSYLANTASLQFNAEWTPIFSTVTGWVNEVYDYQDDIIAITENQMTNTISQDFRWLISPTVTFVFGGSYTDVSYDSAPRNYQTLAIYAGADWLMSPTMILGGRVGGQFVELEDGNSDPAPFGEVFYDWQIGAKSSLDARFEYSFQNTDIVTSYGQEAATFTLGFDYQWTPLISSRLEGIVQVGSYNQNAFLPGTPVTQSFDENLYGVNISGIYNVNNWLDLEVGYSYVQVTNDNAAFSLRSYDRNRIWFGVRGTY
jgi:hypothetical protein